MSYFLRKSSVLKLSIISQFFIGLLFFNSGVLHAQSYKVNPELQIDSDVSDYYIVSPDGSRVVYASNLESYSLIELYSAPISGGAIIKLNGTLVAGGGVSHDDFVVSADGRTVVYRAVQDNENAFELYSVPISGGTTTRLTNSSVTGGVDTGFKISPNGNTVVYRAIQDTEGVIEIYSVPITGGASTKLNNTLASDQDVYPGFEITPDGNTVVYVADQDTSDISELYSVPIQGGAVTKISRDLPEGVIVYSDVYMSPDSNWIAYRSKHPTYPSSSQLFSAPINGGSNFKLNATLAEDGDIYAGITFTPDSSRVLYLANPVSNGAYNSINIYSSSVRGIYAGGFSRLNARFTGEQDVFEFKLSPDGSRVVYIADQDDESVLELYSATVSGGVPVKLNQELVFNGDVYPGFKISPDNKNVVFKADKDTNDKLELFSVKISGGSNIKLNSSLIFNGDIGQESDLYDEFDYVISPDGRQVVYKADQDTNEVFELYITPINGGEVTKVSGEMTAGGDADIYQFSSDNSRLIYYSNEDINTVFELFGNSIETCKVDGLSSSEFLCEENFSGIQDWNSQSFEEQTVTFNNVGRTVTDVILDLRGVSHDFSGDVNLELVAPNGTSSIVILSADINSTGAPNFGGLYRFVDGGQDFVTTRSGLSSTSVVPSGSYSASDYGQINSFASAFNGVEAEGTWTLRMSDTDSTVDSGVLSNWRLILVAEEEVYFYTIPLKNGKSVVFSL